MQRLLNTLLARLLIGFAIPVVIFVAVALVSGVAIMRQLDALELEQHTREVIRLAQQQQQKLDRMRLDVWRFPLTGQENLPESYSTARAEFAALNKQLTDLTHDNPPQQERLRHILALEGEWNTFVQDRLHTLRPQQGQLRKDLEHVAGNFLAESRRDGRSTQLQEEIEQFIRAEEELLQERRANTAAQTRESVLILSFGVPFAILLIGLLSFFAARNVTEPINRLREAASRLIGGKFALVPVAGPTEIAQLIVHFNHMAISLSERASLLEKQEERYRTYVGASSHILWTTNPAGEVIADIPTWRAFTGQDEEVIRGMGWMDAVHPADRPAVEKAWRRAVEARTPYEGEFRLRSASGEYRDFYCRGVPIFNPDKSVREWICTCADITERKREASLRLAKEAAENASRAKSEFLAKMSHELRTPLNAVIGMSRMLTTQRFGPLNAKQTDYLTDINRAGEHLLALINDILDLAKVEAGRMDVQPETFSLAAEIDSTLSTVRSLALAKKLDLRFDRPEPDGKLTTDPARFRQVLFNLLSNAIKFTPAGSVTVTCQWVARPDPAAEVVPEDQARAVRVTVCDTGIGIPKEEQTAVWEEFRQLKAGARNQEGTGLGLALTRRLVQLLGGTIWLESEPGKGSTFTCVLPRDLPAVGIDAALLDDTGAARGPIVLIVEDYPPTHKLLVDWFRGAGLLTASAYDGETGLALARKLQPQLLVLDVKLPRRDGWQVLTELKSDPQTACIPVVIVTVTEDRRSATALGVQDYFVKPVDRDVFLRRLRRAQPSLFNGGQANVLLVDDDPIARKLLGDMLRAEGLRVIEATNGHEALARLEESRPTAVFLDLLMPAMDGFEVIEAVRNRPEWGEIPILVVTAKDVTEEDRERIQGRIQALLSKHILTPEKLQEYLAELRLHRAQENGSLGDGNGEKTPAW